MTHRFSAYNILISVLLFFCIIPFTSMGMDEIIESPALDSIERKFHHKHSCSSGNCFSNSCNSTSCHSKPSCFSKPHCSDKECSIPKDCSSKKDQITIIKHAPFVITQCGTYCVAYDLTVPSDNCSDIISIQAHNVLLNLNGFTLSGGLHGVVVDDGSINAIIQNGIINNTQSEGILIKKASKDIQLIDLLVTNCNQGGGCPGFAGILFDGTITDFIKNSFIQNVTVSNSIGSGFRFNFSQDCSIKNASAQQMSNSLTLDAAGFYCFNCDTLSFDNCTTFNIFASQVGRSARGFFAQNSENIFFNDCSASQSTAQPLAVGALGFHILGCQFTTLDFCSSTSHSAPIIQYPQDGFRSQQSVGSIFNQCTACHNAGSGFILLSDSKSSIFKSSSILNLVNGYFVSTLSNDCIIGESKALSNGNIGFFYDGTGSGDRFYNNFSARTTTVSNNYVGIVPIVGLGCSSVLGGNINGDIVCQ